MMFGSKRSILSLGLTAVIGLSSAGCGLFGDDDKDSDRDRRDRRDRLERRDRTDRDDRTSGVSGVPDRARVVASGTGRDLSYKADANGTIYVYDAERNRVVMTERVREGERFTISPDNRAASLEGREISGGRQLEQRTEYRLLFDGGRSD